MEKIIKEFYVYDYEELSDKAKEKAKCDFLESGIRNDDFTFMTRERIDEVFPKAEFQYSLSYCQGDGVNIYGDIYANEIIDTLSGNLTKEETDLLSLWNYHFILPYNNRYSYSVIEPRTIYDQLEDEFDEDEFKEIEETIISISEKVYVLITDLENRIENEGYKYLYEISDEEMITDGEANGLRYLEDGSLFIG